MNDTQNFSHLLTKISESAEKLEKKVGSRTEILRSCNSLINQQRIESTQAESTGGNPTINNEIDQFNASVIGFPEVIQQDSFLESLAIIEKVKDAKIKQDLLEKALEVIRRNSSNLARLHILNRIVIVSKGIRLASQTSILTTCIDFIDKHAIGPNGLGQKKIELYDGAKPQKGKYRKEEYRDCILLFLERIGGLESFQQVELLGKILDKLPIVEKQAITDYVKLSTNLKDWDGFSSAKLLCQIVPNLSGTDRVEVLNNVLTLVNGFSTDKETVEILEYLAIEAADETFFYFGESEIDKLIEQSKRFKTDIGVLRLLGAVFPYLPQSSFPKIIKIIDEKIIDEKILTDCICNIIPYIPSDLIGEIKRVFYPKLDTKNKIDVLEVLIPRLDLFGEQEIIEDIQDFEENVVSHLVFAVARDLSKKENSRMLLRPSSTETAEKAKVFDKEQQDIVQAIKSSIIDYIREQIGAKKGVCRIVQAISNMLSEEEALTIVDCIKDLSDQRLSEQEKAVILISLSPKISTSVDVFMEIIGEVLPSDNFGEIKVLSTNSSHQAKAKIKSIEAELSFALKDNKIPGSGISKDTDLIKERLIWIWTFSDSEKDKLRALRTIQELSDAELKLECLTRIAPHLSFRQRRIAGQVADEIRPFYPRAKALTMLAIQFSEFRQKALVAARILPDPVDSIEQLSILAIEMPELLPELVQRTRDIRKFSGDSEYVDQYERKPGTEDLLYDVLLYLSPHLSSRIIRDLDREHQNIVQEKTKGSRISISNRLFSQTVQYVSRSYNIALRGGSLRNDSVQSGDLLNLQSEIDSIAQLLLMKDLEPPMAVGILGGWGWGKSYIMYLMQQAMLEVRCQEVSVKKAWKPAGEYGNMFPFVGHIYQIKFDAWTYSKSDVWASLMQTIFVELDRQISIEFQLRELLKGFSGKEKKELENKIWPVLYESNDDERAWFLERVLTEEDLFKRLQVIQDKQGFRGVLWKHFQKSQSKSIQKLKNTKEILETKKKLLEAKENAIKTQVRNQFAPILNLQADSSFQRVEAFLGTSFTLLRRRIGDDIFCDLNTHVSKKLYDEPSPERSGLWTQLDQKLEALAGARHALESLSLEESDVQAQRIYIAADETLTESERKVQVEEAQETVTQLLREVSEVRFNIFNVAATVIEKRQGLIHRKSFQKWLASNWLLVLLFVFLFAVPLALTVLFGIDLFLSAKEQISNAAAKIATLLAPLLPGSVILQNLVRSSQKWFEETRLALKEYEASIENRNKQLELTYENSVKETIVSNPIVQGLRKEILELEQIYEAQKKTAPVNQYASLSAFVSDRLEQRTYSDRLGFMQQIKQDLTSLTEKLLPPSQYDENFQTKIDFLKEIFPRGHARVVVYIDDLDRCPPDKVVEVLEAVQLLIRTPLFIAVLGIDERYITRALEKYYAGVLSRHSKPSGADYLEKIIQLPYRVRPLSTSALEQYLKAQVVIQDNAAGASKFNEFSREEFEMLMACCQQVNLSPRTLKRLLNVYKLFKTICRTRGEKISFIVQQAAMALLTLSSQYPGLMYSIFEDIDIFFEERHYLIETVSLKSFFIRYEYLSDDCYIQSEIQKMLHDAVETDMFPENLLLHEDISHEIFKLIRSFSFINDSEQNPNYVRVLKSERDVLES